MDDYSQEGRLIGRQSDQKHRFRNANARIATGMAHKDAGRFSEALASFNEALHVEPNNPDAYLQLSVLHGEQGRWQESLAAGYKLVELKPNEELSYLAVAGACQELK